MTIRATHFDPKVLLSAPRRSAGVPNAAGSHVLFTTSTYSFDSHSKSNEFRLLDTRSGESTVLSDKAVDAVNWLDGGDEEFVWLQSGEKEGTEVWVGSVKGGSEGHYVAGRIEAPAGNLKVAKLDGGEEFAVVVSALAGPDGELFDPTKAKETHSTGKLYTGLYVRHWDAYRGQERNALWYGKLARKSGKYALSGLTNALKGTGLESPIEPFGGTDHFDVSERGVVFVAKDPELDPALNTKSNVYLLNVESWTQGAKEKPKQVVIEEFEGASTSPVFSPDARQVAFLAMRRNGYESDQNRIFVVGDLEAAELKASREHGVVAAQAGWDRSPSAIAWTVDGKGLLATAEDVGHARLFLIQLGHKAPFPLTKEGSVGDVVPLGEPGKIFYTGSSLIDNSVFAIIQFSDEKSDLSATTLWTHSNSGHGSKFGLKSRQVSSIWTPASNPKVTKEVHSWVLRPSNFDDSKKYPVAYLIHGGPQGAWGDSWSTRWNPAVFAEQGFVVVSPNITGSTGYGQAFTDAINKNWGGDPLGDIENAFEWVGKHLPEADNDRAVALGASYGGYMMNCKTYASSILQSYTNTSNRDSRPRPRPQIQSPRLPRRHLQLRQHALHRRTLLPPLRPRRHALGPHRLLAPQTALPLHNLQRLAPLGPLRAPQRLGHAAARHPQFQRLPHLHLGGPGGVQCAAGEGRGESVFDVPG
jgi:dipeptidyl aminopeptidase/acylaminoacyl peptidase